MDIKQELRAMLAKEGLNFSSFSERIEKVTGEKYSVQNLFNKFAKKTLRVEDLILFCDLLGYQIKFEKTGALKDCLKSLKD